MVGRILIIALLQFVLVAFGGIFSQSALADTVTATGSFGITIPGTVSLVTDAGNANDSFPAMAVTVDILGNMTGITSLYWNLSSNASGGALVTVYVPNPTLPAAAGSNLSKNLKIRVTDAGGPLTITPVAGYVSGRALSDIPVTAGGAEAMFRTTSAGHGRAMVSLVLNATVADGSGPVHATITMRVTSE